jgi:hypothetical protein
MKHSLLFDCVGITIMLWIACTACSAIEEDFGTYSIKSASQTEIHFSIWRRALEATVLKATLTRITRAWRSSTLISATIEEKLYSMSPEKSINSEITSAHHWSVAVIPTFKDGTTINARCLIFTLSAISRQNRTPSTETHQKPPLKISVFFRCGEKRFFIYILSQIKRISEPNLIFNNSIPTGLKCELADSRQSVREFFKS